MRFAFDRQRRVVTPALELVRRRGGESWGVRAMTLAIGPGEGVALLGAGGSGKTTLLRLLAGVFGPDEGSVLVEGRVAALLSTDAGLVPVLTGAENTELLGVLYGRTLREMKDRLGALREASRLGEVFDRPVSTYSQGMRARLGLLIAEESDPEIVLLDEVHEVLDHAHRGLLERHARAIRAAGGIVVAAGHDHPLLASLATRAVWLEAGRLRADGPFEEVRNAYLAASSPASVS